MRNNLLKKLLIFGITLLFIGTAFVTAIEIKTSMISSEPVKIQVLTNGYPVEIEYTINRFNKIPVKINDKEYTCILLDGESNLLIKDEPDLPNICRSIIIPDTAQMKIKIKSYSYRDYENFLVAPSKGNLLRTVNPDDVPYEFGEVYTIDDWYPKSIAELGQPYILRDFRGQVVKINPFQYNPVKKILRFYYAITVEVYQDGNSNLNSIYRNNLPDKIQTDFKQIYENHFINFNNLGRYDPVEEQGNMLVVTYDAFWDDMLPFVQWKNMKGIPTEMVNVSTIGDANAIKTYIEQYYYENNLTFVLLVGDIAQIPSLTVSYFSSDPSYSYILGNDHYPDLFVGRFSAENIPDVQTQVERSIEYEKYPQSGAEWYHKGTGVASNLGPGDDGEYDNQHMDYIRDDLLAYTYTLVDQIYDPTGTAAMVSNALNEGRGIVNYCGHGSMTSWGSTGFSNTHVNALVNDNMLPYVVSVACYNGMFDGGTCFAEAWMRATNNDNGEPTGSVANFMSAKSQAWDPPMDAQDEIVDILVESYADNKKTTIGGLSFNGCMHMNDEYGSAGWVETDAWTVFGDPSLQIRTDTPINMTVIHAAEMEQGATTFEVTVLDVENALCAISRNNILLGYGYTDATGYALVQFDEPLTGEESLDLVVTAYNKIPYYAEIAAYINTPPTQLTITGPATGRAGKTCTFHITAIDPDGDDLYYFLFWGDGSSTGWLGLYGSGEDVPLDHRWNETGTYHISVKARDTYGDETDWVRYTIKIRFGGGHNQNNLIIQKIVEHLST